MKFQDDILFRNIIVAKFQVPKGPGMIWAIFGPLSKFLQMLFFP